MTEVNLNTVNLPKLGLFYADILKDVEIDPRAKRCIYQLANDLHETDKRLNDAIRSIVDLAELIQMIGIDLKIIDGGYKKENQTGQ